MSRWLARALSLRTRAAWLAGLGLIGLAGAALARVGGGETFGGGGGGGDWGGGGGGGGGDGTGELLGWLVFLAVRHPYVGIPLLVAVAVGWHLGRRRRQAQGPPLAAQEAVLRMRAVGLARRRGMLQEQLAPLLEDDPHFSELLFLDFAQMIYTRFQEARGGPAAEGLGPYLSEELMERLERIGRQLGPGALAVDSVVVGAVRLDGVTRLEGLWLLGCELEANYTERLAVEGQPAREQAYYARARLMFRRRTGVRSRGPETIRTLGCPGCGSPVKLDAENLCAYCGRPAEPGLFHWELQDIEELSRMQRAQAPLPAGGEELGVGLPTVFHPELDARSRAFGLRYPGESLRRLEERAREVFLLLQQAWTSGEWEQARGLETDRLFQMHLFWMDRYRARGLQNVLEDIEVHEVILVKLDRDAFFELATVRIKARMRDYTVDAQGQVVAGRQDRPRTFSEYWTFLRRAGFEPRTDGQADASQCPSCGAPAKVGMHGRCEYCDAHLTAGEFDWTLALIEQDEAYGG
jgi:predicted lipid-binding transport protein (Tim44 family)